METALSIVFILLIGGTVASFFLMRSKNATRGTGASGYESGTLTVTGVGDVGAQDKNGESYVTVSGVIIPVGGAAPVEVYGTLVLNPSRDRPYLGQELPVHYKPGKVESSWRFGTVGA
ncbi:MAG: hypothetical protein QM809_08620 [Gordonia sp. (in: high G+C Gram-positive bacteria)]|uniref:hypothetical protein n=1 Tax=Gordonia sp. (in: high G+C Gram-positive bacteria) TaxID=84139 RepID=UPI0039E4649A